jgi:hypothetical protein
MATAARTKSRVLSVSVAARTSRATVVQLNAAVITTMRYALTGINRHGRAALGECLGGLFALAGGIVVVRYFGFAWVGPAIFLSVLLVTGWLYPRELKRALGGGAVFPARGFWIALLATTSLASGAGWAVKRRMP